MGHEAPPRAYICTGMSLHMHSLREATYASRVCKLCEAARAAYDRSVPDRQLPST